MPKQNVDDESYQRMMCPAEAGKAQCSIKPHTMDRSIQLPLVEPDPSPVGPLKICRQNAITVSAVGVRSLAACTHICVSRILPPCRMRR